MNLIESFDCLFHLGTQFSFLLGKKKKKKKRGGGGDKEKDDSDDDDEGLVGIIVADLDEATVEGVRERMPVAEHREAGRRALGL